MFSMCNSYDIRTYFYVWTKSAEAFLLAKILVLRQRKFFKRKVMCRSAHTTTQQEFILQKDKKDNVRPFIMGRRAKSVSTLLRNNTRKVFESHNEAVEAAERCFVIGFCERNVCTRYISICGIFEDVFSCEISCKRTSKSV